MDIAAIRQVRSESCSSSDLAALADAERGSFLLALDLVELVPTNISNFLVMRKELFVHRHDQSFKRTDDGVVDIVMIQDLLCIWGTCIESFDIAFTCYKLQP